ncbi:MAG: DUF4159 domain-containing protein [Bacteroidetes bacterium]|nr:DUF4159 domain-containing protein [Bacteroidota bacterium]
MISAVSSHKNLFLIILFTCSFLFTEIAAAQQDADFRIARVQYRGGGDWYNDPSSLTNLIRFANANLPMRISERFDDVAIGSRDIHRYPFLYLTGHGNITINTAEAANVRRYLDNGGFLYIDDDYGLDPFIRPVLREIFPDDDLVELPFTHPIFHQAFSFPQGLPKVHEHDGKPPQGFAIFREGRMVVFYTYESNLADGWADADVHSVPEDLRIESLQMGANVLYYVFSSHRLLN